MPQPTRAELRTAVQEVSVEVKLASFPDALHLLSEIQAALGPYIRNFGQAGISGIRNPLVTVALYLNVAKRNLEARDGRGALVALESALDTIKDPLPAPSLPVDDDIRLGLSEIARLTRDGYTDVARSVIGNVQTVLEPMVGDFGPSGVRARGASVSMYLNVAQRDLEAGDVAAALVSLDLALTTWRDWPVHD